MPLDTSPTPWLTPELLSAIAGIALSLLASYLPGFSEWFERLQPTHKRLVMLGLLVAASAASVGLACAGLGEALGLPAEACSTNGVILALRALIAALTANQAAYALTKA
jgi:hypothetical protein